ncbi:MAG: serine hydrolase [Actinomycetota bacterium]|nr:serine hydrolase [Actinomycetota bacterium]
MSTEPMRARPLHHRGGRPSPRHLVVLSVLLLVAAACGGTDDGGPASTSTTEADPTTTTATMESSATTTTSAGADEGDEATGPAAATLTDVIGWLNGDELTATDYEARFSDDFRTQVPYDAFTGQLDQLRDAGPWSIAEVESASDTEVVARIAAPGTDDLRVSLAVTGAEPAVIAGLLLQPADQEPFVPPAGNDEAIERLQAQGEVALLVARTGDGECAPLLEVDAERSRPVGSVFKLWVLGAVADTVAAGETAWDAPVTIRDELDSLPSGTTQDVEPGTELSVRELAERMISVSDNTATDHLIDLVGRDAVEAAVADLGHSDPAVNAPFLTTRELFILKFGPDADLRERYVAADEAGRRDLLASEVAAAPLPDLTAAVTEMGEGPRLIEELEWFGSPLDVCRALVGLTLGDDADPVVREVLAVNPGVPDTTGMWDYLGFKGGSEPGVLAGAWAHETADGATFATIGMVTNDETVIDETEAVQLIAAVRDLTTDVEGS